MNIKFFLVISVIVGLIFVGLLIYTIINAKKTSERNNAAERARASIFSSQIEEERKKLKAQQKLDEIGVKPSVADYSTKKRPVYSSDPQYSTEQTEEPTNTKYKLGDFVKKDPDN